MIQTSEDTDKIFPALFRVQEQAKSVKTDKYNEQDGFNYLSLNGIHAFLKPLCCDEGLFYVQPPIDTSAFQRDVAGVQTVLIHPESGQFIDFGITTMPIETQTRTDAGTTITRCRKYALSGIFGFVADNDVEGSTDWAQKERIDID